MRNPLETLPVFRAGEAITPAYNNQYQPLSGHGAYISGIEAARDVVAYLENPDDESSFKKYYNEKYEKISAEKVMVAMPPPLNINLRKKEFKIIEEYANMHTNGDINLAVEDLPDYAIRDQG